MSVRKRLAVRALESETGKPGRMLLATDGLRHHGALCVNRCPAHLRRCALRRRASRGRWRTLWHALRRCHLGRHLRLHRRRRSHPLGRRDHLGDLLVQIARVGRLMERGFALEHS